MELVLATTNVHKVREIREMLKLLKHLDIISLLNYPDYQPPEEDGSTFQENALIKAQHAARELQMWVLADDSGLVVPAIGGEPGIFSRRYSGEEATDRDNNNKLLQKMGGLKDLQRAAYYECALCVAGPRGDKKIVTGTCEGLILDKERGSKGFGYDPLFLKNDYDKTFGELDENTKNRVSHRRKAFDKLTPYLESLR